MLSSFALLKVTLLAASLLIAFSLRAQAATYYVAPGGDDKADGLAPDAKDGHGPFRTLKKAAEAMQPGDVCLLREGIYRETLKPLKSGTEENPLVFGNYKDETAILSAADELVDWVHDGKTDSWSAPMPWTLENANLVLVDGERLDEARWPQNTGTRFQPVLGTVKAGTAKSIIDPAIDLPAEALTGARIWCAGGAEWYYWSARIDGFDAETGACAITPLGKAELFSKWYMPKKGNPYAIIGLNTLPYPNQWRYDENGKRLHLRLKPGIKPDTHTIAVKRRECAIDLKGCSHIRIEGIQIRAGGIATDSDSSHILLSGLRALHLSEDFTHASKSAVELHGSHITVRDSEFACGTGPLVIVSGEQNHLHNCWIHDGNEAGGWQGVVSLAGARQVMRHCTISDSGRDLVRIMSLSRSLLEYNNIYNAGWICKDLGMLYGHTTDFEQTEIRYNWVHDNRAKSSAMGIYFDHCAYNALVHHNVIWNVPGDPIRVNNPGYFMLICNNSACNTKVTSTFDHAHRSDLYGMRFVNNIVNAEIKLPENAQCISNLVNAEPGYRNSATNDYRLVSDSLAIGKGVPIPGITPEGEEHPDLGAIPFKQEAWKAGHDFASPPPMLDGWQPRTIDFSNHIHNACFERGTTECWETDGAVTVEKGNTWGINPVKNSQPVEATGTGRHTCSLGQEKATVLQRIEGLRPQTNYVFSGWVHCSDAGVEATLEVEGLANGELTKNFAETKWVRVEIPFRTGKETSVTIKIGKDAAIGIVRCDNFGLMQVVEQPAGRD